MWIVHRSGKKHLNADALSRDIAYTCQSYSSQIQLHELPCGGCKYCSRAHEHWHELSTDIDDAIPLAQMFEESSTSNESSFQSPKPLDPKVQELLASDSLYVVCSCPTNTGLPSVQIVVLKGNDVGSVEVNTFDDNRLVSHQVTKPNVNDACQAVENLEGIALSSNWADDIVKLQCVDKSMVFLHDLLGV